MRIRSLKPDFWRSEDVAALDWDTRLVFIGLWSYVDDNGVGRDNEKLIVADLFALEDDSRETVARVSRALQTLCEARMLARYTVAGTRYLFVNAWDKHQKIDRPNKPRYPRPTSEDATFDEDSRESRDTPSPGAVEQGNRGTGDTATRRTAEQASDDAPETTATLVALWIEHCSERPPKRVIGQVSKEIKTLLDEGFPFEAVRAGLAAWHQKNLNPAAIASVFHETRQGGGGRRTPTTTARVQGALALVAELEAEEEAQQLAIRQGGHR